MRDIDLALMTGIDVPIPELQLIIHPPTIKDIAYMGETNFFQAMTYLCIDKDIYTQDETVLGNLNNFQILMRVLGQSDDKKRKNVVTTLLMFLFPAYKVAIMPQSIILTKPGEQPILIDEANFDNLQSMIKAVLCVNNIFQGKNIVYNPEGEKAKQIAKKIAESKKKIAAQKAHSEGDSSILTRYLSVLRVGSNIPLTESRDYNLFQLFDQMERYEAYKNWEVDLQVRLAGGEPDKQVENWMRNLYNKHE